MSERIILDYSIDILKDKVISVVGYGNQGRAQAIVMRDHGLNVIVGNIRDEAWERAVKDGFNVYDIDEAAEKADIALLLVPDEVAPEVYRKYIVDKVLHKDHFILGFASGYNISYGFIKPLENMDVILVAPRMIGAGIIELHKMGRGYPVLLGVAQDVSGKAWEYAAALSKAIGAIGKPGGIAIKSSFEEETMVDLMTEHTWMPLLIASFIIYFELLTKEYGVNPETAILELYASGELAETAKAMAEMGLFEQFKLHSRTSQYGQLTRLDKLLKNSSLWEFFKEEAEDISTGRFAKEWSLEQKIGSPIYRALLNRFKRSPIAEAEDKLYKVLERR